MDITITCELCGAIAVQNEQKAKLSARHFCSQKCFRRARIERPEWFKHRWGEDAIESEMRMVCDALGWFPSSTELREMGRNDLACAISKSGGFLKWADRLGVPRRHSDSDTGWQGEREFDHVMAMHGHAVTKPEGVKSPYDRMIDGVLRVDVKAARYASFGPSRGWFYRIAKHPQADLITLYQLDTGDYYALPYWVCPTTNVMISRDGGKYAKYRNDIGLIRQMIKTRQNERTILTATAEKAAA